MGTKGKYLDAEGLQHLIQQLDGRYLGNSGNLSATHITYSGDVPASSNVKDALDCLYSLIPATLPANGGNADTVDNLHASNFTKFYLSPMDSGASASSAKTWFTGTMPASSGAIVYNVPGSEKTIIAGKSSGNYGHMLQLNYDDNYLRLLRYKGGNWQTTDWEKISAGYADSAGSVDWSNVANKPTIPSYSNATQSTAGLMSATDKTNLDTLAAMLTGESDQIVDTIQEVLEAFETFDEGGNIATLLSNKLDKTGGTMTGAITLNNEISLKAKNSSNTSYSILYVNSSNNIVFGNINFGGIYSYNHIFPISNNTYNLGTSTAQWNNIYGKTLYENGTSLSSKYLALSGGTMTGALTLISRSAAYNDNNILFSSGSTVYSKIGGDTSKNIGIYTKNNIYLRPGTGSDFDISAGIIISKTNVTPSTTNTVDLGDSNTFFKNIYGNTLYEGGTSLANKYLSNYTLSITRDDAESKWAKFVTVDYSTYTDNYGAYFKLSAMSSHPNGRSYSFLEDIIINVIHTGGTSCVVYKYKQFGAGAVVDNESRYYGDVFYTKDATNKIITFFILCGQYTSIQFTPVVKIGSTTLEGVTQQTGAATYYETGYKYFADGNKAVVSCIEVGKTYVNTSSDQTINGKKVFTNLIIGGGTYIGGYLDSNNSGVPRLMMRIGSDQRVHIGNSNIPTVSEGSIIPSDGYKSLGTINSPWNNAYINIISARDLQSNEISGNKISGNEIIEGGISLSDKYQIKGSGVKLKLIDLTTDVSTHFELPRSGGSAQFAFGEVIISYEDQGHVTYYSEESEVPYIFSFSCPDAEDTGGGCWAALGNLDDNVVMQSSNAFFDSQAIANFMNGNLSVEGIYLLISDSDYHIVVSQDEHYGYLYQDSSGSYPDQHIYQYDHLILITYDTKENIWNLDLII